MKIKLLSALLVILICTSISFDSSAQYEKDRFIHFGIKAGLNSSKTNIDQNINDIKNKTGDYGFFGGVYFVIGSPNIALQPEIVLSSIEDKIEIFNNDPAIGKQISDIKYRAVSVPVLVNLRLIGPISLVGGPVFSFNLDNDIRTNTKVSDVEAKLNSSTVGFQLGASLTLNRLNVDLRYENNLSRFGDEVKFLGRTYDTDLRTRQLRLSLGIRIF